MKTLITAFLLSLISLCCPAQKRATFWCFGAYAVLDFAGGTPVASSTFNDGAMSTDGACATISDEEGNLLFYTDGATVWNRTNKPMPNGHNLWSENYATQTLIIPQPGSDSIYFVFTATPEYDYIFGPDSVGFHYSVVDMGRDGGLGDVVKKNILLFKKTTEKMSAVFHANGKDVWLVAHEWQSNSFRSYLITENGIDTANYITSSTGVVHAGGEQNNNTGGQMKLSPNGTKIAVAIADLGVQVFDFDNSTGVVSNPTPLIQQQNATCHDIVGYNGIEFSSNSQFLYFIVSFECPSSPPYDMQYLSNYDIQNKTIITIDKNPCKLGFFGDIQLAIDGKIYLNPACGGWNFLGAIENPNQGNNVNLNRNAVSLVAPSTNSLALPNFIQSYFLFPDPVVEMPNVFTPNGDLFNERFVPMHFENIGSASLTIVNRWGEQVFQTDNPQEGWDGGVFSDGIYYWFISYYGKNGKQGSQRGWVQLIR